MANEPIITVVGNLAGDPELRFTANGHAVANFTIAQTPRNFDRQSNQWVDDETLWVRCSVWREAAENVAESLVKGTRVVATGRLKARSFEDKEGNQRTNWELDVDEVGPSLRWATAQVTRSQPGQGGGGGYAAGNPWQNSQYTQQPQQGQPQPAQGQPQPAPPMNQPQGQPQGQQGQFQQPQQGGNAWTGQPGGWDQPQQDGPPPF